MKNQGFPKIQVDEEESDTVSGRMLFIMVMLYLVNI